MRSIFGLIVLLIISSIVISTMSYIHTSTVSATVTGKERIVKSDGDGNIESFYLVYTDKGTMKLEDDLFRGNWNSSDVYGSLRNDSTYTFTTSGYRIGFFSMYPNIIEVK
jgi:hypothetical protein